MNKKRRKVQGTGRQGGTLKVPTLPCALRPAPCAKGGKTPVRSLATKRRKQCPDCSFCQGCSQDRCRLCRATPKKKAIRLSMAEQIALYERINRPRGKRKPQSP